MGAEMTEEKLIQAILEESHVDKESPGLTTVELVERLGVSRGTVCDILGRLKKKGKIVRVWVYREILDGRRGRIPAYIWAEEENA